MQCARTWTLFLSRFASLCSLGGEGPRIDDDDPRTQDRPSCCMAPPACKRILIESIILCTRGQRGVSSRDGRLQTGHVSRSYPRIGTRSQRRKRILFIILLLYFLPLRPYPCTPADAFIFHEAGESASCTLPDQIPVEPTHKTR